MAETPMDADEFEVPSLEEGGGTAVLRDRYFIDGSKPLPDLDSPNAKAYMAEDRRDLSRKLFALICTPGLPVRTETMAALRGAPQRGLMALVEWDSVIWPAMGRRVMAVIFERPMGGRAFEKIRKNKVKITEYDIPKRIVEPLIAGIQTVASNGATHRAIRPDNIFFADEECEELILGECVTAPPGFDQPTIFEPLDKALAMPAGRGEGTTSDDLYSLGATVVVFALGHNPLARVKPDEQVYRRMDLGSYAAICGNARIPMSILEPLRGLLADNRVERWGLGELDLWVNGRKQTPQQKNPAKRADAPYRFNGRDHTNVRTLAHAFTRNVPEAVKTITDDAFLQWVKRLGGDGDTLSSALKAYGEAMKFHEGNVQGTPDYLVTRASVVMDPDGPLRYKGLSFVPEGIGPIIALELIRKGNCDVPMEIISKDIYGLWMQERPSYSEVAELGKALGRMKQWLNSPDPGYGIERCLYESNPGLACQSDLLQTEGVLTIDDLLPALDEAANSAEAGSRPMDHHIAGFIAARFSEDIAPHLRALASPMEDTNLIGMLSLLAFLQWKRRSQPVLGLASWIGGMLGPAINGYHNRNTRRDMEREIPRLVRKGSLPELFDLIDNAEKRREDSEGYEEALDEYAIAEAEIREIEGTGGELVENAMRAGQKSAAMVSVLTTMVAISVISLVRLW